MAKNIDRSHHFGYISTLIFPGGVKRYINKTPMNQPTQLGPNTSGSVKGHKVRMEHKQKQTP